MKKEYIPIPVHAAKNLSEKYAKSCVIIAAWDPVHGLLHTTTYGRNDTEREWAAKGGEIVARALGAEPILGTRNEDFRPCVWCGKQLEEHEDDYEGRPKPRVPCLLLKNGYAPRGASHT